MDGEVQATEAAALVCLLDVLDVDIDLAPHEVIRVNIQRQLDLLVNWLNRLAVACAWRP